MNIMGWGIKKLPLPPYTNEKFPKKMSAEEIVKLKDKVRHWTYSPKGSLF